MSLFSCNANKKKMLELPMMNIEYRYGSQMISTPSFSMYFFTEGDQVYATVFDTNTNKTYRYHVTQADAMDQMRQLIRDKKIYSYKEHYNNRFVLDGDFWSFHATFGDSEDYSQRQFLSSSGSNAGPRGDGLSALAALMKQLIADAERLYACDEEGHEIPDVPIETMMGDNGGLDYLSLTYNEYYRRMNYRLHDIEKSEQFGAHFPNAQPSDAYNSIQTRAEKCYGAHIFDEGKNGWQIYMIVENGAIESMPLSALVKGENQTSRFSKTAGLTDVRLVEGKVMGIDKQGQEVLIEWE